MPITTARTSSPSVSTQEESRKGSPLRVFLTSSGSPVSEDSLDLVASLLMMMLSAGIASPA
jgi:hypothetical protein